MEQEELATMLSNFSCCKDPDIENYLLNRAIDFEQLQKSRTYLIMDEEQLIDDSLSLNDLIIYGYYSLALKVLSVPDSFSNNQRRRLDGFNAKYSGQPISDFPCYLIGQLARNSKVSKEVLSGREILRMAYSVILEAVEAVGGRIIMVECHDDEKLISFYEDNDFSVISSLPDNDIAMKQMIRRIK